MSKDDAIKLAIDALKHVIKEKSEYKSFEESIRNRNIVNNFKEAIRLLESMKGD